MTAEQYLKNLTVPTGCVDVVLDTDAYNEIDDQFAISYMLKAPERMNVKGICAAPFFGPPINTKSSSAADGMEKSYDEILKLLNSAGRNDLKDIVYKGSAAFLPDEETPVASDAAAFMAGLANQYSPEKPLYIIAIGAITNVASAILMNPAVKENTVIVWLGGHAHHMPDTYEFNMFQDVAAARVVFNCGVPVVQLPCFGVVSQFTTSRWELEHWLKGKNALCDYLVENTIQEAESYAAGKPWTRPIWDVTAVAWLLNDGQRFMQEDLRHSPICQYDHHYSFNCCRHLIRYIYNIKRDALFEDLFTRLAN